MEVRIRQQLSAVTYEYLAKRVQAAGHPFFDSGDYNLNLIGMRTEDNRSNLFNDWLFIAYRQNDHEQLLAFQITTDPGIYWRENPMHVDGTAIVKPGHYPRLWTPGLHQGKYPALIQVGEITVYRDNDQDYEYTQRANSLQRGYFGINLHRAGKSSTQVDKWSAGCQVFQSAGDYELFMALVKRATENWGDLFSYTLLTEKELWA